MHSINSRNENLFNIVVSSTSLKEEVILSKTKNITSKNIERLVLEFPDILNLILSFP